MDKKFLRKHGEFIDFGANTVDLTETFYIYDNKLWLHKECLNRFSYMGETKTLLVIDDLTETLKQYSKEYFINEVSLSERGYSEIVKLVLGQIVNPYATENESYQLYENSVGNLSLFIMEGATPVEAFLELEGVPVSQWLNDIENWREWDGRISKQENPLYGPETTVEESYEISATMGIYDSKLIADESYIYPDKMGDNGKLLFNIEEEKI